MGDLWVKGVAPGSEPVQLTNTAGIIEERPVWSPDGNTLYYNRGATAGTRDLYRKSPVTLGGRRRHSIIGTGERRVAAGALSGRQNASASCGAPRAAQPTLYLIPVDGGLEAPFADDGRAANINCVWSPDGTRIIYTLGRLRGGRPRRHATVDGQ